MILQHCTFSDIMKTSNLLPFTETHTNYVIHNCKKLREKGLEARFHPSWVTKPEEVLAQISKGVFVLHCPQIEMDFVYTCENGGVGFFGGQKRIFKVFGGDYLSDDFSPATSFKSCGIALTSVNNIFRGRGLLQGMA